jgi:hypothetical protein
MLLVFVWVLLRIVPIFESFTNGIYFVIVDLRR